MNYWWLVAYVAIELLTINVLNYRFEGLDTVESPYNQEGRQNRLEYQLEKKTARVQIESVELAAVFKGDLIPGFQSQKHKYIGDQLNNS